MTIPQRHHALPESLAYLPGYFRADVESPEGVEHHFVRWLLQVFESNLHFVERFVENSSMMFEPNAETAVPMTVAAPTLSASDLVDLHSLVTKLTNGSDALSAYLWERFSPPARARLLGERNSSDLSGVELVLVQELNRVIWGESIYDPHRFHRVKFSPATHPFLGLIESLHGERLARFNRRLLEDAFSLEIQAQPESPLLDPRRDDLDLLRYLAAWVGLDLDEEWMTRTLPSAEGPALGADPAGRYARAWDLLKRAVPLYRRRGTSQGLRDMIKAFYNLDVEILERSCPQGMEIGVHSSIGVNSWILDEHPLDEQFTVVFQVNENNRKRLDLERFGQAGHLVTSTLVGDASGRETQCLLAAAQPDMDSSVVGAGELRTAVNKLRDLLDREKPAHTRYYLAVESKRVQPPSPRPEYLVIGLHSEIERFWIS